MVNNKKWALFDFCETLVNFPTADEYVRFVLSKDKTFKNKVALIAYDLMGKLKLYSIVFRITPKWMLGKRFLLYQLKGYQISYLEKCGREYFEEMIRPNIITPVMEKLEELQKAGYNIAIISGGYDLYIKYFCEYYNIGTMICSKIKKSNGRATGTIEGLDCVLDNKLSMLNDRLGTFNREDSYAFTDSITDLPLLNVVGHPYVIKKSYETKKWAANNKFNIINYDE